MPALVFDLGGTHLRAAVAFDDGSLSDTIKQRISSSADGTCQSEVWSAIRARMSDYIRLHENRLNLRDSIVISFPGPVDGMGRALNAPTLFGDSVQVPDIRRELEVLTGRPVRMLNDLSAAAWCLGREVGGRFMVVTVSSGIGSKIFDPAIGSFDDMAYGGEIGHGIVDESHDAPRCDCGGRGHLGAIASGRGMERMGRQLASNNLAEFARSACVTRFGATPTSLNNELHLVPALRAGDAWTIGLVRNCTRYLARVLVAAIMAAGLRSVIVIGGFALAAGDAYLQILRDLAGDLCDYTLLRDSIAARITLAAIGEEACLVGAGLFANSIRPI